MHISGLAPEQVRHVPSHLAIITKPFGAVKMAFPILYLSSLQSLSELHTLQKEGQAFTSPLSR